MVGKHVLADTVSNLSVDNSNDNNRRIAGGGVFFGFAPSLCNEDTSGAAVSCQQFSGVK
jgi:hypothetical protein